MPWRPEDLDPDWPFDVLAARFELRVDPATAELCASMPMSELPSERIFGEIEKLLVLETLPKPLNFGDRLWDFIAFGIIEVSISVVMLLGLGIVLLWMDWRLALPALAVDVYEADRRYDLAAIAAAVLLRRRYPLAAFAVLCLPISSMMSCERSCQSTTESTSFFTASARMVGP